MLDIVGDKTKIALITNYAVDQFERSFDKFYAVLGAIPKENILVSAKEKLVKPDIEFYKLMIERCKFDRETTLFIDDEKHNVEAAIKAGIHFAYLPGFGIVVAEPLSK